MLRTDIKKIAIFGRSGSGKSTFANRLSYSLSIPLLHLDTIFWLPNWIERPSQNFLRQKQEFMQQDAWIIEGNSIKSLEMRCDQADKIIYFNYPLYICFWRVLKRFVKSFIYPKTSDRPIECQEKITFKFIYYIISFNKRIAPILNIIRQKYPDKLIEISNDKQLYKFYQNLYN